MKGYISIMKLPEYYPDIWFRIKLDIDFSDLDIVFRFMLRLFTNYMIPFCRSVRLGLSMTYKKEFDKIYLFHPHSPHH